MFITTAGQPNSFMMQTQSGGVYDLADDENNYHLAGSTGDEYENNATITRFAFSLHYSFLVKLPIFPILVYFMENSKKSLIQLSKGNLPQKHQRH